MGIFTNFNIHLRTLNKTSKEISPGDNPLSIGYGYGSKLNNIFTSSNNRLKVGSCPNNDNSVQFFFVPFSVHSISVILFCGSVAAKKTERFWLRICNFSYVYYAPNFGKVEGAYWFGPIRPSVCLSVTRWQLRNSRTAYVGILKLYMWHVHEK